MEYMVISYPKLRRKPVLADIFEPVEIDMFRKTLDHRKSFDANLKFFLVKNNDKYILISISPVTFDNDQLMILFEGNGFADKDDSEMIDRAISFVLYEVFYILKSKRAVFLTPDASGILAEMLYSNGFTFEGRLERYFRQGDSYSPANILSISEQDFLKSSIALIKFNDEILVLRATRYAVFSLDIIRNHDVAGVLSKEPYSKILPDEIKEIIMKEKIYIFSECNSGTRRALDQICEYIAGTRTNFDLHVEIGSATEFQKSVWNETMKIRYGETASYEQIARAVSQDKSKESFSILSRAVGSALSRNPVMLIIPCHRVIGKDGKLRGFAGGIDIKDYLLTHEMSNIFKSRR
ncbi:MAG: methylated-DNA--[protein]-cysteine S-methyltransferase [Eubacteriales bacterium]|nr:methylated-DNA--[protein]-cysteine S-methyltransferase [Eubacteriales bacterium]MDD4327116.1 methylated-DNA--[protein]-cysteine S-methyltransferase [Eubacteriales bacterium]MDD4717925.1 methylated-DNA--[protein]-cysteine S-methyltransferase [Eubacteriales bacterium]